MNPEQKEPPGRRPGTEAGESRREKNKRQARPAAHQKAEIRWGCILP